MRLEPSKRFLNISIELFQFHKGAIRTMQEFIENCLTLENFNSIKVRLELVFYCTPFDSMKNFNSIKVRLEPDSTSSYLTSLSFQFHKGAIRTGDGQANYKASPIFKFHKGAIRTQAG